MYALRSESVRVRRARSPLCFAPDVTPDNLNALLRHNVAAARVVAFETSPMRILSRHAYKNALVATRRLTGDWHKMAKAASSDWQRRTLHEIERLLKQGRIHAMVRSTSISDAQDVFVLLSHYLGVCAVPDKLVVRQLAADVPVAAPARGAARPMPAAAAWMRRSASHKRAMQPSASATSLDAHGLARSRASCAAMPHVRSSPNKLGSVRP